MTMNPTTMIDFINDTSAEQLTVHPKLKARAARLRELRCLARWLKKGGTVPSTGPGYLGAWQITFKGLERNSELVAAVNTALDGDLDRLTGVKR